jgi:hypothetical protein
LSGRYVRDNRTRTTARICVQIIDGTGLAETARPGPEFLVLTSLRVGPDAKRISTENEVLKQ